YVAVLEEMAGVERDPDLRRELPVADEMAVLAVDRDEVSRPDEVQDELQLLLRGVARHVHPRDPVVVDDRAAAVEVVHEARDRALVPGDDARGKDHRVARREPYELVIVHRDPDERRRG